MFPNKPKQDKKAVEKEKDVENEDQLHLTQTQVWKNESSRAMNTDMWQRFGDCILCDQKSVPNTQGMLIHHSTRNILIGFNKTLQVWKYEQSKHQIE